MYQELCQELLLGSLPGALSLLPEALVCNWGLVWSHMVKIIFPWRFPVGKAQDKTRLMAGWFLKLQEDASTPLVLATGGALLPWLGLWHWYPWIPLCTGQSNAEPQLGPLWQQGIEHQCGSLSSSSSLTYFLFYLSTGSGLEFPILSPKCSQYHIWLRIVFCCWWQRFWSLNLPV